MSSHTGMSGWERLERMSDAELEVEEAAAARALAETVAGLEAVAGPDPEGIHLFDRVQLRLARVREVRHMMAPALSEDGPIRPWPAGERRLHLYLLPDLECPPLAALLARVEPVLGAHTGLLTPVPQAWLHATVGRLDDATPAEAAALARVLGPALAYRTRTGPVHLTARLVLTTHGLLLVEADTDSPVPAGRSHPRSTGRAWSWSFERDRAGIDPHRAHQPARDGGWHLTLAHCRAPGTGRHLAADLTAAGVLQEEIDVRFAGAVLAWVTQHPGPAYTWETVAEWALPGEAG